MRKITTLLFILPMMLLSACGVAIVDSSETGFKKHLGNVDTQQTLSPGMYFYNPFTSEIITMDNRVQKQSDTTPVYTRDVQKSNVAYAINYNLRPTASATMYVQMGWHWEDLIVPQVVAASIKNVIGQWNAIDLIANREKAGLDIQNAIATALDKQGINVVRFEITNIDFDPSFEKAVEDKVTAVQRAEEAKNNTVRVQEEANQRIIAADADAKAMSIKTAALKESQSLVLYEAVQKWNGVLPTIVGGSSMLNIPKEFAEQNK